MKGFQLELNNNQHISAGLTGGVITIILDLICFEDLDRIEINFSGLQYDNKKEIKYNWLNSKLDIGDELKVKLVDVIKNSSPKSKKEISQKEIDERDLQSFISLEKRLKKMNLI